MFILFEEFRTDSDKISKQFIDTMQARYPLHLQGHTIDHMELLFDQLYLANCQWYDEYTTDEFKTSTVHVHVNKTQRYDRAAIPHINAHRSERKIAYPMTEMAKSKSDMTQNSSHTKHSAIHTEQTANHTEHSAIHTEQTANHTEHSKNHTENSTNHTEHFLGDHEDHHREHSIWEHVAHGMHKASITILGILFVEVDKIDTLKKIFTITQYFI